MNATMIMPKELLALKVISLCLETQWIAPENPAPDLAPQALRLAQGMGWSSVTRQDIEHVLSLPLQETINASKKHGSPML